MKITFSLGALTAVRLAELCEGKLIGDRMQSNIAVEGICTDSREAGAGVAFCALRGERVDGHSFIGSVLERGCGVILCEHIPEGIDSENAAFILVSNVEASLSVLAMNYKRMLSCKTVAVTGSVGKTTTKDMISSVLEARFDAFRSQGNYNSVIGMPLSMLEIPSKTEYAVLEMGMSGFGEIERLSMAAQPDFAVITTIGTSHLEMLGSRENICRAKLEILCGLKRGGTIFLNGDEPLLEKVYGKSYKTVYVSTKRENAEYFAKNIMVENDCTRFDIVYKGRIVKDLCVRVVGAHNVYSALFAFAIGIECGMSEEEIRRGLLGFAPAHLRQNIYRIGNVVIMEDCYNASPESMKAAIDVLQSYKRFSSGKTVAVLGDMLELGEESTMLHRQVGAHLAECGVNQLYTLGKGGGFIAVGAKQCGMPSARISEFPSYEDRMEAIAEALCGAIEEGDVVLFKASRGVRIERLIEELKKRL